MNFRKKLSCLWNNVQYTLFPDLTKRTYEISREHKKLITILEIVRIEEHIPHSFFLGRPPKDRIAMARAFIAKIALKIPFTNQLVALLKSNEQLRVICGWESNSKIPSESKFSRAFNEFSISNLPDKAHQALIKDFYQNEIVGHVVTDSTGIEVREKKIKKSNSKERRNAQAKERRRKKKAGEPNRREEQLKDPDFTKHINNLPKQCDLGMKKCANGFITFWKGYKLHASVDDHGIPLCAVTTSASCNDCEVAIPLAQKRSKVVSNFYNLMDAGYDYPEIKEHSLSLGQIPIIETRSYNTTQKNEKKAEEVRKKILNFETADYKRYKKRWPKESFNALYKDYYGGRAIYYRGFEKVSCYISFGILTVTASLLMKFI